MSKTISCPFCQSQISVDETAAAVVCMVCGKGFSLGVAAQPGNMQPQMQYQQPPMQQQFAPQMQYQQPPMMPANGYNQAPRRRRPGNGLFVTGIIFNALAFLAGVFICVALCAYLDYGTRSNEEVLLIACFFGNPFIITAFILNLISIAKYWSLLPPRLSCGTSSWAAVGFMFIPFFNLYWVWVLHMRLVNSFDNMINRMNSTLPFGIAAAILIFLGMLSPFSMPLQFIGYLIALIGYQKAAKVIEP